MAAPVFLAAVLALQLLHVARGEIKTTPIVSDSRPVILFEEFGFKPGGVAQVSVSGVSWSVPEGSPPQAVDPGLMGFILISNTLFFKITNESEYAEETDSSFCPLTSEWWDGWGMQEREKNVLMIIIPLQVIENIASAMIGETGPAGRDWLAWNQIFLLVDVVCCCAVFFPIIWSIRNLREASKTDGKAARNLKKLTLFKQFYLVVVGYLYFTRIAVSAFAAVLSYKYQWVVNVSIELASLAFYVFVFYNFQPVERNPYLYIADEEEEAAGGQLELEGTFEI
uniref:Protein GPR107 n=1 Tax=Aegilops tauschii TaxID=37682 RepID=M8BBV8_AEGTA